MSASDRTASQVVRLSREHIAALNRPRRVVVNYDAVATMIDPTGDEEMDSFVDERLAVADDPAIQIDSIWWNWGEGNVAPYPSKVLPRFQHPGYEKWIERGFDIARLFLDATHRRGIEAFFSHRMNGSDNDPMYVPEVGVIMDMVVQGSGDIGDAPKVYTIPLKEEHPDWLFQKPPGVNGYWNYAVHGVRDHVLRNLREVAEDYEFDGIELDFARGFVFPEGQGWPNHDSITAFIREMRLMLLEIEERRGRPFLLAARVPDSLVGCHFDGLDVETWAHQRLVDIFAMGSRSFEVDVPAFRQTTEGTHIKLYGVLDDHHSSDGYCTPPIEVFRGVFSNWYRQGADGVQTFNSAYGPLEGQPWWQMHMQAYREMGDPGGLKYLDKTFVVQRRGGGHGPSVHPDPEDWSTPRFYANTNMLSQLPAALDPTGKADTLVTLFVGDNLPGEEDRIDELAVRVLLHDRSGGDYVSARRFGEPPAAEEGRLQRAVIRDWYIPERPGKEDPLFLYNYPPPEGLESRLELRINNALLGRASVERGWLVFAARPDQLALGDNLLGLRMADGPPGATVELLVEKLELHVKYR